MLSSMLYIFWMLQRTMFGPVRTCTQDFVDLNGREMAMLIPIMMLLLITGIVPSLFIPLFEPYLNSALQDVMMTIGAK